MGQIHDENKIIKKTLTTVLLKNTPAMDTLLILIILFGE
jgi:hypothetical protein